MSDSRIHCKKCCKADVPASMVRTFTAFENAIVLHFSPDNICAECTYDIVNAIGLIVGDEGMSVTVTSEDQSEVARLLAQCGIDIE